MMKDNFKAFSLVEMLMALLVASLLLAALAPVMTRRMQDFMTVSVEGEIPGKTTKHHEITYQDCLDKGGKEIQEKDKDGNVISEYCEGIFDVPAGYNGDMNVTVIGAGGGGGVAPTAGFVEYITATEGSYPTFVVPAFVNEIEATLISGGAGGGAGGQVTTYAEWKNGGSYWWTVPDVLRNRFGLITACGGGGGGGGGSTYSGGGGGSGGYIGQLPDDKRVLLFPATSVQVIVGGYGGAGGHDNTQGNNGGSWLGGGGGSGVNYSTFPDGSGGVLAGRGGKCLEDRGGTGGQAGTGCGGHGMNGINPDTLTVLQDVIITGGIGCYGGGKGGDAPATASSEGVPSSGPGGGGGGGADQAGGGGGGSGAGSGGGGGGATVIGGYGSYNGISLIASGGGGGGGGAGEPARAVNQGSGGGGGGGNGGGAGGNGGGLLTSLVGYPGFGGTGGNPAVGTVGGQVSTIFGNNNCSGGSAAQNGKPGAMRITYLDYGVGGSGGGGGQLIPVQPVNVTPNETLNIKIGSGAVGGTAGRIDISGAVVDPTVGSGSNGTYEQWDALVTRIYRGSDIILTTSPHHQWSCTYGGSYTGQVNEPGFGCAGNITTGADDPEVMVTVEGFSNISGYNAGNSQGTGLPSLGSNTYSNGSTGGAGGRVITPWFTCTSGRGGENPGEAGGNAQGYGCGGGGGYGLSNGGNGSGGYARISWNKYWDTALNSGDGGYKYASVGAAGGGASGNIMTYKVTGLQSGVRIKIRIGKGGAGGKFENNVLISATNGGDTVFAYDVPSKRVSAGGGKAGLNPSINSDTKTIINGAGGTVSTLCHAPNDKNYTNIKCSNSIKTNCCTQGLPGGDGTENENGAKGGAGGDLAQSNLTNKGGTGGTTGSNASGTNAYEKGIGSGGGGAGILDIGTPAITTYNPNTGGNGSNGKIILEWWE